MHNDVYRRLPLSRLDSKDIERFGIDCRKIFHVLHEAHRGHSPLPQTLAK
jgi:hypothetical protein